MKIFERVLKVHLVRHMEANNLLKHNQHGFVSGMITQMQLLQHYSDMYEALSEGVRIDTVYLAFGKAFGKINHNILQNKLAIHEVKGKIDVWLKNFLQNRKYRVVAKGVMSDEQDIISGIPQGMVLASIFFIIMISDIDENLGNSISRLFADDTKISSKIRNEEDIDLLQQNLNNVYT